MPLTVDILLNGILDDILIIGEILVDYIIESIIYYKIIYNNSFKLLYDPILL